MLKRALFAVGVTASLAVTGARADSIRISDCVLAYSSDWYAHYFSAGDAVLIAVSGDGDTDLDLFVWSPGWRSRPIAEDTGCSDECLVLFRAPVSGVYRIQVKNLGSVGNRYEGAVIH